MLLHERLKYLRINQNLSQAKLAKDIDVGARSYQRYEYGDRIPTADIIIKLAKYFGVSADYLLGLSDDPTRR